MLSLSIEIYRCWVANDIKISSFEDARSPLLTSLTWLPPGLYMLAFTTLWQYHSSPAWEVGVGAGLNKFHLTEREWGSKSALGHLQTSTSSRRPKSRDRAGARWAWWFAQKVWRGSEGRERSARMSVLVDLLPLLSYPRCALHHLPIRWCWGPLDMPCLSSISVHTFRVKVGGGVPSLGNG